MVESARPETRRRLLQMVAGAIAGLVGSRLIDPPTAAATQGLPVILGAGASSNDATSATIVKNTSQNSVSLSGEADGSGTGVLGLSQLGPGVAGASNGGVGVRGYTMTGHGLEGVADSAGGKGVYAQSDKGVGVLGVNVTTGATDATGVIGLAGIEHTTSNTGEIGVYGYANSSVNAAGVVGQTVDGTGTVGVSTNGTGVLGAGPIGVQGDGYYGVYGSGRQGVVGDAAPTDTGVFGWVGAAAPPVPPAGVGVNAAAETSYTALNVVGRARFSRSGRTSISKGHSSRAISVPGVTTASYIIATLQTNRAGVYVQAVVPASGKFTIYLNKAVTGTTYVGYMVIN